LYRYVVAHVPLPDQKDIEGMVLEKKKKDLMAKYASAELMALEAEAKDMLNAGVAGRE
jgi:pre-mRNA-splicing factor ISY1